MDPPVFSRQLGDELCALVSTIDSPLVDVTPLAGMGYPGYQPSAFRLRFADGCLLKGRRFGSASRAATVEYVLQHVDHPGFPKVLARSGKTLLMEWVEGQPLNSADCTLEGLRQCGALQGVMHCVQVPEGSPYQPHDPIQERHAKLKRDLTVLAETRVLNESEAQHSFSLAMRYAPRDYAIGFVHRDFCVENLIRRPSGDMCVIDNETLAIDAYDYDLGRTWYRWPLRLWQRQAYLDGYQRYRSAKDFLAHFPYWGIAAVVGAAVFRVQKHIQATLPPTRMLRLLLHDLEQGGDAEELAFRSWTGVTGND